MALSEFFERQRQFTASRAAVKKRATWNQRGSRYLRGRTPPGPRSLVQSDPDLNEKMADLIERAYPVISRSFNKHLGPAAVSAFDAWPVESGLSKSLVDLAYSTDSDSLSGVLECRAPYAYYIREPKGGKRRPKDRRLSPAELVIMSKPPKGVDRDEWTQAVVMSSKVVDPVTYGYARAVVKKLGTAKKKRRRGRKGKRVSDELVFGPATAAANRIFDDISKDLGG